MFAFGGNDVSAAEVEFLDEMLAGTSFDVLAEFFPSFSRSTSSGTSPLSA